MLDSGLLISLDVSCKIDIKRYQPRTLWYTCEKPKLGGYIIINHFIFLSALNYRCALITLSKFGDKRSVHAALSTNFIVLYVRLNSLFIGSSDLIACFARFSYHCKRIGNAPKMLPGGRLKNACELLNLRAIKISVLYKNYIFQCMGKTFCVEFQKVPLKFHTKYLTHTLKDVDFIHKCKFTSS